MTAFDYSIVAELFATRSEAGLHSVKGRKDRRASAGYGRFARAVYAIRFAIEELPAELLSETCMEVNAQIFAGDDIRRLYESEDYPLARRASPMRAANVKQYSNKGDTDEIPSAP
jgi:hypothetical protein